MKSFIALFTTGILFVTLLSGCSKDVSQSQNVKIIEEQDPIIKIIEERDSIVIIDRKTGNDK